MASIALALAWTTNVTISAVAANYIHDGQLMNFRSRGYFESLAAVAVNPFISRSRSRASIRCASVVFCDCGGAIVVFATAHAVRLTVDTVLVDRRKITERICIVVSRLHTTFETWGEKENPKTDFPKNQNSTM